MIIDLDNIYKDGKLFGQDIYFNPENENIPCFDIIKNNHQYIFSILWNWENCHLVLCCFTIVRGVPYRARTQIGYDTLFSLKGGLVKTIMNAEIEKLINTIEQLIYNDKKDNRDR
jgi:hypothetical protein